VINLMYLLCLYQVIHEIIASEKSYVQHLNLLCGWYLQPLKCE